MTRSRLKLVLELDVPDSSHPNEAGFPSNKRHRSSFTVRIPWIERSEADSDDAHWQNVEWQLRKSLAFELLGTSKNVLASITEGLVSKLRAGVFQRTPGFCPADRAGETMPSPPPSTPPETLIPPPTPTLPSQAHPALEPAEGSDHVDVPSEPGVR